MRPRAVGLVLTGGAVGTAARYGLGRAFPLHAGGWPTATFTANLVGAFLLGLLLEALARRGPDVGRRRDVRLLAGVGFCGAFTTYSSLALEVTDLLSHGHATKGVLYGAATLALGFGATFAGIVVGARTARAATE